MKTKDNNISPSGKMINNPEWPTWIGKKIQKHSSKPFKNGMIVSHPVEMTVNTNSNKPAFVMLDGSVVDCQQCKLSDQTGS